MMPPLSTPRSRTWFHDQGLYNASLSGTTVQDDDESYNGSSWSSPQSLGPAGPDVSCPTTTFCMAAGTGDVVTYDGSYWSNPSKIDPSTPEAIHISGVSCATTPFCVAVDENGNAFVWS